MLQYLITAIIDYVVVIFALFGGKNKSSKATATAALCLGLWSTELFLLSYITDLNILYPVFNLTRAGMFFIPFAFFLLAYSIVEKKSRVTFALLSLSFFSTLLLCIYSFTISPTTLIKTEGGYLPEIDATYYAFVFLLLTNISSAIIFLLANYKSTSIRERQRINWLMLTLVIGLCLGFASSLSLFLSDFLIKSIGAIANIIFVSTTFYTTQDRPLMDIKPALKTIFTKSIIIVAFIFLYFLMTSFSGAIVYSAGGVLILALYISAILYSYPLLCKIFVPEILYSIDDRKFSIEELKTDTINMLQNCTNTKELNAIIQHILRDIMKVTSFQLTDFSLNEDFHFYNDTMQHINEDDLRELFSPAKGHIMKDETSGNLLNIMREKEFEVIFPILNDNRLTGVLFSGLPEGSSILGYHDTIFLIWLTEEISAVTQRLTKINEIQNELEQARKTLSIVDIMNQYHHDIKTPLFVIDGVISTDIYDKEQQKNIVLEQVDKGTKLIATMASVLGGKRKRNTTTLDIDIILQDCLVIFENRFHEVTINMSTLAPIIGDAVDLKIMFINVIKNSAEAGRENDTLKLHIESTITNEQLHISLRDNGIGMSTDSLEYLWHSGKSTKSTGSGIGLQAIKRIADEHKAEIFVESSKGVGTSFTFKFPIANGDNA